MQTGSYTLEWLPMTIIKLGIPMRPKTIVYFEIIMIAALILRASKFVLDWDSLTRIGGIPLVVLAVVFNLGWILVLTLLVSRRRSRIAMWISIALFAVSLPFLFVTVSRGVVVPAGLIPVAQALAQLIAYRLLFTPSARAWLAEKPIAAETSEPVNEPVS